ncbi:hypothetical protein, partial [Comamonas sp.]|uniref:hypothetical protein n=1 Tax=Comamonas sp. TaxID=34028 RepID=UPI002FC73403
MLDHFAHRRLQIGAGKAVLQPDQLRHQRLGRGLLESAADVDVDDLAALLARGQVDKEQLVKAPAAQQLG